MRLSVSIIAIILIIVLGVITFFWSGKYDISADTPHWSITKSVLESIREKSVNNAAADIQVPDNINDESYYAQGIEHYQAMCISCHLAPGKTESELRMGLYPKPPAFTETHPPGPRKAFWIIKHGLKMTAMPAWGKSHSDEAMWKVAAFVQHLPDMTEEQYSSLVQEYGSGHHHEIGGNHDHGMHSDADAGEITNHHSNPDNETEAMHTGAEHDYHNHEH